MTRSGVPESPAAFTGSLACVGFCAAQKHPMKKNTSNRLMLMEVGSVEGNLNIDSVCPSSDAVRGPVFVLKMEDAETPLIQQYSPECIAAVFLLRITAVKKVGQ